MYIQPTLKARQQHLVSTQMNLHNDLLARRLRAKAILKEEVDVSSSKQVNNAENTKCLKELPEKA